MVTLVVTGTGTGVGKTAVAAAVAALSTGRTAVVKAAQTGVAPGAAGDADEVARLVPGAAVFEIARYAEPLAPATAARRTGREGVRADAIAHRVRALAAEYDLVVVEGAGGLLVRLHQRGDTLADAAAHLGAPLLLVARAGLGTLNETAMTTEVAAARGLACVGTVIGSWPARPDLAARCNLADLEEAAGGRPLLGALPDGVVGRYPASFADAAAAALAPRLGGRWQAPQRPGRVSRKTPGVG